MTNRWGRPGLYEESRLGHGCGTSVSLPGIKPPATTAVGRSASAGDRAKTPKPFKSSRDTFSRRRSLDAQVCVSQLTFSGAKRTSDSTGDSRRRDGQAKMAARFHMCAFGTLQGLHRTVPNAVKAQLEYGTDERRRLPAKLARLGRTLDHLTLRPKTWDCTLRHEAQPFFSCRCSSATIAS